jgi:hypothetical protein
MCSNPLVSTGQCTSRVSLPTRLTVFAYCVFLCHLCPCRKAASRKAAGQLSQPGRQAAAAVAVAAAATQAPKGLPLSWLDIFMLSAVAKIGATLVTYPLLVVKNRLQVSS